MKNSILFFSILFLLTACIDNTVYFKTPQPEGGRNEGQLPARYRGRYLDTNSNLLTIDKKYIVLKTYFETSYTKTNIDHSKKYYVKDLFLIERSTGEKYPYKMRNDTLFVRKFDVDTLFRLSKNNIARKFRGNLILNFKEDDKWRVEALSLDKLVLKHRTFDSKDLLDKLSTISDSEVFTDSTKKVVVGQVLTPTKKQLGNIINQNDTLLINEYTKIK